jgi:hypothetical protein
MASKQAVNLNTMAIAASPKEERRKRKGEPFPLEPKKAGCRVYYFAHLAKVKRAVAC